MKKPSPLSDSVAVILFFFMVLVFAVIFGGSALHAVWRIMTGA